MANENNLVDLTDDANNLSMFVLHKSGVEICRVNSAGKVVFLKPGHEAEAVDLLVEAYFKLRSTIVH